MITSSQLALSYALDLVLGDPEWFPHPVRIIGSMTSGGERLLRMLATGARGELWAGAILTAAVTSFAWAAGRPRNAVWRVMLAWSALATRSLLSESGAVIEALAENNNELARVRVARIVGRDTQELDATEISRAVVETLAESACDGIVAPLFWLTIGGVPAAMAYKAINTMDSMIGHPEPPYRYFGSVAARADDVACFIPARLTAIGIALSAKLLGLEARNSWRIWLRDGKLHASPNAGQSEAAMAGALSVQLGGLNLYSGQPHHAPLLNAEAAPATIQSARIAVSIVATVSGLAFVTAFLLLTARRCRV